MSVYDETHTPYDDFMTVRKALLERGDPPEEAEEALDRIEQELLRSLSEMVQLRVGMYAHNEPEVPDLSDAVQSDLLNEYRRLCAIEDSAKALLIGRLRDMPEEEMARLWGNLARAADAPSPLGADSQGSDRT